MRAALVSVLILLAFVACSEDPPKKYATYQACFDDLTDHEKRATIESIVKCCIEHEIGGMKGPLCGDNDADCINYLTNNLSQTDADITTQMQACSQYLVEKAQ